MSQCLYVSVSTSLRMHVSMSLRQRVWRGAARVGIRARWSARTGARRTATRDPAKTERARLILPKME
eukprot:1212857-Alexandrium_andersonii.AAC.1